MNRNAVALMLTLFMLLAMSAALSVTLSLFQKNLHSYSRSNFRVQSTVLLHDTVEILKSLKEEIGTEEENFDAFISGMQEIPLKINDIDLIIRVRAKNSKFNINRFEREKHYEKIYAYLLAHDIQRPGYILELIEDTLDEDVEEQQYGSERILYDPFFLQGEIVDLSHFKKLLDTYAKETKDMKIYSVPWKDWICFEGEFIDEDYMTLALLEVITTPGGKSEELSDFDTVGENSSEFNCEVYIRQEQAQSIAVFDFSFETNKVSNFKAVL